MKKQLPYLIAASIFLIINTSFAQVTLTASGINPIIGESFTTITGNYVNPGNSGINQTWNLSAIVGTTSFVTNVISTISAPGAANFPNATIAWDDLSSSATSFFTASATALQFYGQYDGTPLVYSDPLDLLHYPFSHTNMFIDFWKSSYTNGSSNVHRSGIDTITADGYGALTTPVGTFTNVIRLHLVQSYKDSSYVNSSLVITNGNHDEYFWYKNGVHHPLAYVSITIDDNFGTIKRGTYLSSSFTGINEVTNSISNYSLYPNPTTTILNLNFNSTENENVEIKIVNTLGSLLKHETIEACKIGFNSISMNIEELPTGLYFTQILVEGNVTETKRFVVAK